MKPVFCIVGVLLLAGGTALAQTKVDLRTQSKNVDFSQATATRPVKTGTSLPSSCQVGELFFKTDAPAGQNLYACTSNNSWSVLAGGSSSAVLPSTSGQANRILSNNGTTADWRLVGPGLIIDSVQLAVDTAVIPQLFGANEFHSTNTFYGVLQATGPAAEVNFTGASSTRPVRAGTTPPANCVPNEELFLDTDDVKLLVCNSTGTGWVQPRKRTIQLSLGDGQNPVPTGLSRWLTVDFSGKILSCRILADRADTLTVTWLKKNAGLPAASDSIGSCSLASQQYKEDRQLSSFNNLTVNPGDWFRVNVTAAPSAATMVTVALEVQEQ